MLNTIHSIGVAEFFFKGGVTSRGEVFSKFLGGEAGVTGVTQLPRVKSDLQRGWGLVGRAP